jgi:hypothetical protein
MYKYSNLITILTSGVPQHKTWRFNESKNEFEIQEKQFAKFYEFQEVAIKDINSLYNLLKEYSHKTNSCFVRGKITDQAYNIQNRGYRIKRTTINEVDENKKTINPATIQDYPKKWLMLDIDYFEIPKGINTFTNSGRQKAVECFINTLHESFHNTSYVCQFSNGMFANSKNLKAHLWFILSESYSGKILRPWFEKNCELVDKCVFRPAQLLYTANPTFIETFDPLKNQRVNFIEKNKKEVTLPKKQIIKEYLLKNSEKKEFL